MLNSYHYRKVLSLHKRDVSIRKISRLTGHSRKTIHKILNLKSAPQKPTKCDDYSTEITGKLNIGGYTAKQIHIDLVRNGFNGSYSTVRRYYSKLRKKREKPLPREVQNEYHAKWLFSLVQGKINVADLNKLFGESLDSESIQELFRIIIDGSLRYRNRSLTIFADQKKIPKIIIAESLGLQRKTVRNYIKKFKSGGLKELFNFARKAIKKYEEQKYHDKVFQILHSPPSSYGFNCTTWRMKDLHQAMAKEECALSKFGIRKIIKKEGYRFVRAKRVLTNNDP